MAESAWTGGQYSLLRLLLAVATPCFALALLPNFLLAIGSWDRLAAGLLGAWRAAAFFGGTPVTAGGLALCAALALHAALPPAPFGSWAARGRVDPAGGWRFPAPLRRAAAVSFGAAAVVSGLLSLPWGAVPAAGAALFLLAPWKRACWLFLLAVHLVALATSGAAWGLLLLQLYAFDPAWLPPRRSAGRTYLFYDGHCGLCHRLVRLILAEAPHDESLRFAPLQGETFGRLVPEAQRAFLPDSAVLLHPDGRLLTRSDAAISVLLALGGLWRLLGHLMQILPRPLRDAAYDRVARTRQRVFGRTSAACPLVPAELRGRFDP